MKYGLLTLILASTGAAFASDCSTTPPTLADRAKPYLEAAMAAGDAFVSVSAASGMPNLAPDSLATAIGPNIASQTATATAPPYPTSLGGISLEVVDSAGASRLAQLLYVSPNQINYLVPAGTAPGPATMNIVNGTGNVPHSTADIRPVAPGLFTANGNGQGVVAATGFRTIAPTNFGGPVQVYQCGSTPGSCVSVPINLGIDTPVFITFYTTGLRGRSSDSAVKVTIGNQTLPVRSIESLDDNGPDAGIDRVTVGLVLQLRGSGEVDVVITADGASSNAGRINIQ